MIKVLASHRPPAIITSGIKKIRMPTAIFFERIITSVVVIVNGLW
jgi:hypothetical protein